MFDCPHRNTPSGSLRSPPCFAFSAWSISWPIGPAARTAPKPPRGGGGKPRSSPTGAHRARAHVLTRTGAGLPVLASRTHGVRARVKAERSEPRSGAKGCVSTRSGLDACARPHGRQGTRRGSANRLEDDQERTADFRSRSLCRAAGRMRQGNPFGARWRAALTRARSATGLDLRTGSPTQVQGLNLCSRTMGAILRLSARRAQRRHDRASERRRPRRRFNPPVSSRHFGSLGFRARQGWRSRRCAATSARPRSILTRPKPVANSLERLARRQSSRNAAHLAPAIIFVQWVEKVH